MGDRRSVYRVLVGKPEITITTGRLRRRWEDNIKIDLQEVRCGDMEWIDLVQVRDKWWAFVNIVIDLRVPYNAENFLTS